METNKYQRGKVYKIVDNTNDNVYIGSTCEPTLARRLAGHVGNYKKYLSGKYHFVTSFNILENSNYDIILIENVHCNSKDELHKRERHYIESLVCVNKVIVGRTHQEYKIDKKETIKYKEKDIVKTMQIKLKSIVKRTKKH